MRLCRSQTRGYFPKIFAFYRQLSDVSEDYYKILGVSRNATTSDIKKAYYLLSKQYHPDVNSTENDAHKRFQKIAEAYKVLGSLEKRRIYDVEHFLPNTQTDCEAVIDNEFAEEIMELNEEIESINDNDRLIEVLASLKQKIAEEVSKMEVAFTRKSTDEARYHLNKLRYLMRTRKITEKKLGIDDLG